MRFNKRYKVYLDWSVPEGLAWNDDTNASWTEIFTDITPLKKTPFEKERFTRYSWGEIIFENELAYSGNAAKLYKLISEVGIDQEVRIKVVIDSDLISTDTDNIVRGYFGLNDCKIDHDKKMITVTPSILDQYTDFVENWETKIDLFPQSVAGKTTWGIVDGTDPVLPLSIGATHNLPIKVNSTDMDEANSPRNVFSSGVTNSILSTLKSQYTATFSVTINAVATISAGNTMKFYLNTYDSNDSIVNEGLLGTYNEMTSGTISTTFTVNTTLYSGDYVRLINVVSSSGNVITYGNISATIDVSTVAYETTDVRVNIQESPLHTIEMWTATVQGVSVDTKTSEYDAELPSLATYFNLDGSPKEALLKGTDANRFAPHSHREFIKLITENGSEKIPLYGLYVSQIEGLLDASGYELSEITVYKHLWQRRLRKDRYITLCTCKFSRFESDVKDGELPVGDNWVDTGYVDSNNKRKWVKKPFDGTVTDWTLGSIKGAGNLGGVDYQSSLMSSKKANYPSSDNSFTVQTRSLKDIVKNLYTRTFPSLLNNDVNSVFFWNDPSSEITVSDGINYFTKNNNWLNNIACAHTYQLKTENTNLTDSKLEVSPKEMLTELKLFFNNQIYWWISTDGVLHLEHLSYIDRDSGRDIIDLTDSASVSYVNNSDLLTEISSFSYDNAEMFSLVEFEIINSGYVDFTKNSMSFKKIVSNKRNKDIRDLRSTKIISTDIRYGIENPTDLDNGMFLLNHDDNYDVIIAPTPISKREFENGHLAISNILLDYKYEGVFLDGTINGKYEQFDITARTKLGKEFTIRGIYNNDFFQNILGVGFVNSIIHDLNSENTQITMKYRFGSGEQSDGFLLMVSNEGDYEGAEDVQFNLG